MVLEHERDYDSQWAAIRSIAAKIGCSSETLRHWVRAVERDTPLRLAEALLHERPSAGGAVWPALLVFAGATLQG